MGKIALFVISVIFLTVFPFFISNNIKTTNKKINNFIIKDGIAYEYNESLIQKVKFKELTGYYNKGLFFLKEITYIDLLNKYKIIAKEALYNQKTKTIKGKEYTFFTKTLSGNGKSFIKRDKILYATKSEFIIKDNK